MADYYPLLARALDALPDRSPGLRRAVYDRARNALVSQLRSLEPPLSEDDIDLERRALDAAIERLEVEHGGIPAPANDAAVAKLAEVKAAEVKPAAPAPAKAPPSTIAPKAEPSPAPAPNPPVAAKPAPAPLPASPPIAAPEPPPAPSLPEPAPRPVEAPRPAAPELPLAPSPRFNLTPEPAAKPREATIAITAPRTSSSESDIALLDGLGLGPNAAPVPNPVPEDSAGSVEGLQGRQRPRIAVVAPRGRSRILRNLAIGIVLIAVIGAIAVAAFLLRDTPQGLARAEPNASQPLSTDSSAETKFGDRVGNDPVTAPPVERPKPRADEETAPTPAPVAPAKPSVFVAQQAVLIEESSAPDSVQPVTTPGRVMWRVDTSNGDQGQPLQTMAVATATYPDAGLTLTMTIRKNLDATLPASHTVSLAFSTNGDAAATRTVQDVGLLQAKDDENGRGSPVAGLPVRVRDNLFLIGLSSLPADVERNMDLLLHRNWFDLAVRYTSGKRAVLTFEKGQSGSQVLQQAFDAWK